MSGCAAIGLALDRIARAQSCGRTQDQTRRQADPTVEHHVAGSTRSSLRSSLRRSEAARRRHTSPPTEARADVEARFARGGPFGGPRAAARIHHRLPTARRGGRRACQEDERRGRTACSQRAANPACQKDGHPRSRLDARPAARTRVEPRVERGGRTVLLASACGRRPLGRSAPAASEASPGVSTSLRRRRGMAPSRRFRSGAGSERSERPRRSCDVVPHCQVGLSSSWSWVRLHAPGSERRAARPCPVSSWHLRAPRNETSTARSARRRRRAARPRAQPGVSRQRPISGCAAIGLALGRIARAQSCGRTQDQEDDRPTRQSSTTSQDLRGRRFAPPLRRFGSGATTSYLTSYGGSC